MDAVSRLPMYTLNMYLKLFLLSSSNLMLVFFFFFFWKAKVTESRLEKRKKMIAIKTD